MTTFTMVLQIPQTTQPATAPSATRRILTAAIAHLARLEFPRFGTERFAILEAGGAFVNAVSGRSAVSEVLIRGRLQEPLRGLGSGSERPVKGARSNFAA